MKKPRPSSAILAGIFATALLTFLLEVAPTWGLPKLDMPGVLGKLFNGSAMPALVTPDWWLGVGVHVLLGAVVFSLIYQAVFAYLRGPETVRGIEWALVLWLAAQVVIGPMTGMGPFFISHPQPFLMLISTLLAFVGYGAVLGTLAGPDRMIESTEEIHASGVS